MRFGKLLKYDLKQGFLQTKWCLFLVIIFSFLSCADFYYGKTKYYTSLSMESLQASFFDYYFFLLQGMEEYQSGVNMVFQFPIKWILFQICCLLGILYYPYSDLHTSRGNIILIKSGSRKAWWISKCIWSALYVVWVYILAHIGIGIFCLIFGESLQLNFTNQLAEDYLNLCLLPDKSEMKWIVCFFILSIVASIAMSMIQFCVGILTKPIVGFLTVMVLLLVSAYKLSPLLLGNYIMGVRSDFFIENGVSFEHGMVLSFLIIGILVSVSERIFIKKDILNLSEL